ncbi:unnamed protein product [Cyprideis torosa]|uniref:Uncharacterized protein n=1 Tax=Cyprideis torosa TaxID=163714 RepID=A0A7R8ZVC9_9CRUS|nr:unnamed protein product [Cyprideis torosa]CAG0902455.1 unnamed protein product [Cyprideis torosa]
MGGIAQGFLWSVLKVTLAIVFSWWMVLKICLSWINHSVGYWKAQPTSRSAPSRLLDSRYSHGYAKLQNGMKLHYVESGNSGKPLMLCLHGFPECWYSWRHQLQEFASDFW